MSTRGLIAIEAADRSCRSIYVHFDMYPSGAGVCLNAHYNTKERIEALFALGDLSGLGGRLSNDDPEPDAQDVCHAYHRDYGEELCPPPGQTQTKCSPGRRMLTGRNMCICSATASGM